MDPVGGKSHKPHYRLALPPCSWSTSSFTATALVKRCSVHNTTQVINERTYREKQWMRFYAHKVRRSHTGGIQRDKSHSEQGGCKLISGLLTYLNT